MDNTDNEKKWLLIEHSLVFFFLTVSGLNLSNEATEICMIPKTSELTGFIIRQKNRTEKPKGILVL